MISLVKKNSKPMAEKSAIVSMSEIHALNIFSIIYLLTFSLKERNKEIKEFICRNVDFYISRKNCYVKGIKIVIYDFNINRNINYFMSMN